MKSLFKGMIIVSLITSATVYAKSVSDDMATNVAKNFMYKKTGKTLNSKKVLNDKKLLRRLSKQNALSGDDTLKLVQLKPKGWVLVSGDDNAEPVLGYSLTGSFDENNTPEALQDLLEGYREQIKSARKMKNLKISEKTTKRWGKYKLKHTNFQKQHPYKKSAASTVTTSDITSAYDTSTSPSSSGWQSWQTEREVYLPTLKLAQGYNTYLAGMTSTGCVATAMSEIIAYHQFPQHAYSLPISYTDSNGTVHPTLVTERPNENYDWEIILMNFTTYERILELSRLMQHTGIAIQTNYEDGWSSADSSNVSEAMKQYFHYQSQGFHWRKDYSNSDWTMFLRTDLRQGFPIYYRAKDTGHNHSGHAFIIEGFCSDDLSNYFTMNFGAGGSYNGDYTLDAIYYNKGNFSMDAAAIFSLKPKNSTYRDVYEQDNTNQTASYMRVGDTQEAHSIDPADDEDWITFWNDIDSTITIETKDSDKDTVMYLYDFQGNQIGYNDDGGAGWLSKIQMHLYAGTYYIKIIEYNQNSIIPSYDVSVKRN